MKDKKLKILLLTDGIYPYVIGGMQKHSYYLARHLLALDCKVTLVHCVDFEDKIPSESQVKRTLNEEGERLIVLTLKFPKKGIIPGHYIRRSKEYSKTIYNQLKQTLDDYDFIYAKGFTADAFLKAKHKGDLKVPIGIKFHGYEMFQKAPSKRVFLEHILLRPTVRKHNKQADVIFSYGGKITDIIHKLGVKKVIEIPTGIEKEWLNVHKTKLKSSNIIKFLFLGRYERRKGIEELNQVISKLQGKIAAEFHFIGPISEDKRLEYDNVFYYGEIIEKNKIQSIMDDCDVFLCPSHSEGMPNVIMEAMSRSLAIIATDVGAIRAVVDSKNGWLIKNPKKDLEKAIISAYNAEKEVLKSMKKESYSRISRFFLWENIANKTLTAISKEVGKK
jgi:glycosyltransferase involved in cell wall biosynthesis